MNQAKVVSWATLKKRLASARKKKKKIVFTNGVFDLVHAGHIKVFSDCRKSGHVVVVGLNSDASVRRLKGKKRPIVSARYRSQLLAGLADVDYVAIFNEDTPERLIRLVRPDVLLKGGDYKISQIVGRAFAKKVKRVPLLKGLSTSAIIKKIKKAYG